MGEKSLPGFVVLLVNDMLTDHWSVHASPLANEPECAGVMFICTFTEDIVHLLPVTLHEKKERNAVLQRSSIQRRRKRRWRFRGHDLLTFYISSWTF